MYKNKLTIKILITLFIIIPVIVSAQLSPKDAISQMRKGINMGNTLEGPYEGDWGNTAQEYLFDMYKKEGFDCVRIPVRWDMHLGKTSPFKIDEFWLKRVEQIIDWGLARGLFIVVNSHHDSWIKDGFANPVNQARFDSLWSQVAVRFKNKSEKLIFEICNEPVNITQANTDEMHRQAINVIRKTNPTRLIIFQGTNWGGSDGLMNSAIPNDKYVIGSFHSYDPYPFGLNGTGTFTPTDASALKAKFQAVKNWSDKNNIPVFLGEFGGTSKCDYNSRMKQYKTYAELSETYGFTPCAWDDGGEFQIIYRSAKTWFDDLKDILVHSSVLSPKISNLLIFQDTIPKLVWANMAADYDSIYIERRTLLTTFKRIAALKGSSTTYNDNRLPANIEYYYRIVAHYSNNTVLYSYPQKILVSNYVAKIRKLFTGQAINIPGKVEAENFDIGGEGLTYHDSDLKNITGAYRPNEAIDISDMGNGVYYVIDNYPGEWLEYTVNIAEKGLYNITASTAAFAGGGTFKIKIGTVESDIISAPTTYSWINTKTVNFSMNLDAGIQIMRITFIDKPLFYIDYLSFTRIFATQTAQNIENNDFKISQDKQELIFNLEMNQPFETLKIYNILGSVVKTIQNPKANFRIPTQDFHSGIYLVQVISGNQKFSKKIIIQ
jgi:aryl-phospho-beta-D-glucosidase BglC (GH1 family)